ncbi:MAG TPA: hypothetical protein VE993_09325 [Stellaceae bacterium]|nr:hypothetical protein [Stellaceae bacterium]
MLPDPPTTGRLFWAWRRTSDASHPAPIQRFDQNKLSWRLSFLVILVLSLALWAAIWEGVAALVRSQF